MKTLDNFRINQKLSTASIAFQNDIIVILYVIRTQFTFVTLDNVYNYFN